jgi:hypothetical protein
MLLEQHYLPVILMPVNKGDGVIANDATVDCLSAWLLVARWSSFRFLKPALAVSVDTGRFVLHAGHGLRSVGHAATK